ncbi:MAG: hypothetical protein ABSC49_03510 [Candidatus Microgenomates bacterium]|jgi:hypothetical protein
MERVPSSDLDCREHCPFVRPGHERPCGTGKTPGFECDKAQQEVKRILPSSTSISPCGEIVLIYRGHKRLGTLSDGTIIMTR